METISSLDVESTSISATISIPTSKGKYNFHDKSIDIFEEMTKN